MFRSMMMVSVIVTQLDGAAVRTFDESLTGLHVNGREVRLSVENDDGGRGRILIVEYGPPSSNPAGRDVRLDAEHTDWSGTGAIVFLAKPDHDTRVSVSFVDRNHVVYTTYVTLTGGEWQPVRIAFDKIHPNPYFQPPDARKDRPLDVSDVKFVAFAPQDPTAGRISVSGFVLAP